MKSIFLSVIIPAYKEAERIGPTLLSLDDYFKNKNYTYEIIVVNDGSPDNLVGVIKEYMCKVRNLRLINNEVNRGKGYAVKCGMLSARGQYSLFMDADNSVSITNLDCFMAEIEKGSDIVIGSIEIGNEVKKEHNGLHRRILSTVSKLPVRLLATPGIYDTQRGFKLFSRKAASIIFPKQTIDRFAFDIEVLVIALVNRLKLKEMPVVFDNPAGSTVRLSAYIESLVDLGKICFKKMLGIYTVPHARAEGGMSIKSPSYVMRGVMVAFLVIAPLFMAGLFFDPGLTARVSAASKDVLSAVQIPNLSDLHPSIATNAPTWLYSRQPMTKQSTGILLLISMACMLLGGDLVSGLVLPRFYSSIRKNASVKSAARSFPLREVQNVPAHSLRRLTKRVVV